MSVFGNSGFGASVKTETKPVTPPPSPEEKKSKGKGKEEAKVEAPKVLTLDEKVAAAALLGKAMDQTFGAPNTLIRLGDRVGVPVPSRPTNLPSLDLGVLGCGGVPKGRIIEVYGPESAGKTTITLHIIAETQGVGGLAAFVDAEHALDPSYAAVLGVDIKNLFIAQPDNGEQALQIAEQLVDSRLFDVVVVDSVAALVPKAELAGEIGDANIGLQARLMSQACRILTGKVAKSGTTLIFINQIRDKIGVMFGNPETTTGGKALKFFASVRLDVRKTKLIGEGGKIKEFKDGDRSDPIGHVIRIKAVKNKVGTPLKSTEIHHIYASGLDKVRDLIAYADELGTFHKRGTWYDVVDKETGEVLYELGNGIAAATESVKANPEIQEVIKRQLWAEVFKQKEQAA